jgi:2-polyprenyl-3-methyl-5-hydroxy-6-metoxy-1,4-benzoquinol methylase
VPLLRPEECEPLYQYGQLDPQKLDEHRQRIAAALAQAEGPSRLSWLPLARYAYDEHLFRRPPGRILDIGCGGGTALLRFARRGWQIYGADYDTTAIQALNTFFPGRFQNQSATTFHFAERFDLIIMSHVIEHLPQPVEALRHVKRYLADSGELLILTPDADSLARLLFRGRWYYYGAQHLLLFGQRAIERVLRDAGCRIRRVEKLGTPAEYAFSLRRRLHQIEPTEASPWERLVWLLPALSVAWLGRGAEIKVVATA